MTVMTTVVIWAMVIYTNDKFLKKICTPNDNQIQKLLDNFK